MAIYRRLFHNNIRNLLGGTFKVTRQLLGDEAWSELIREFRAEHRCLTPLFLELPGEFLSWVSDTRGQREGEPGFLHELMHYEWVSLALNYADAAATDLPLDTEGDLLDGVLVVSALAWPLAYRFPVHRISPAFQPEAPPDVPTFLVVHRGGDQRVHYTEVNAMAARLLELLTEDPTLTGRAALARIAGELPGAEPALVVKQGGELLGRLREEGIVLGALRA